MNEDRIFQVRQLNEEGNKWGISVGRHLAIPETFETRKEAEEVRDRIEERVPWKAVIGLVAEMLDIHASKLSVKGPKEAMKQVMEESIKEMESNEY